MTISSSVGRQFTVNQMVEKAYKYAGLLELSQTPTDPQYKYGRDLLEDILDSLSAEGEQARAVTFEEVTITAAQVTAETYKFNLGSDVVDILNPAMYIAESEDDVERASGEIEMRLIGLEDWHRNSAKDAVGVPTMFAAYRVGDTLQAWVWPIPDEEGTIRFRVHRKLADAGDGAATIDLEIFWMDFVKKRLAADLANSGSLPAGKVSYLDQSAHIALRKARGKANQRPDNQIYMVHRGPHA